MLANKKKNQNFLQFIRKLNIKYIIKTNITTIYMITDRIF